MSSSSFTKYKVKQKLRELGGYLTIYAAHEPALEREVQLRVLQVVVEESSAAYAKFQAEVRALANLDHPGLLKVLDVGHAGDRIYYVTDPPPGVALQERLALGAADSEVVLEVGVQLGQTLAYLHSKGLLHRGISPAGVNVDFETGRVVICDFSLLKGDQAGMATLRSLVDVDRFDLLPERQKGAPADARSDIFLAGALLYALASGKDPLTSSVLALGAGFEFEPLALAAPDCPAELERVLMKALSASPEDRQQSAAELVAELEGARRKLVVRRVSRAMALPSGGFANPQAAGDAAQPAGRSGTRSRAATTAAMAPVESGSGFAPRAAAVTGAAALALLAGAFVFRGSGSSDASSPGSKTTLAQSVVGTDATRVGLGRAGATVPSAGEASADPGDVLAMATAAKQQPTTDRTFLDRWNALATWSDTMPPSPSGAAPPFMQTDLRLLRLKMFRQPKDACKELDSMLEKTEAYLLR